METKANYSIVGIFVLVVLVAGAGFIYWIEQYGRQGPMAELVVRIPGSANGLTVGSPVRFNGIQVGAINKLRIDPQDPRFTIAETTVKADTPVHESTVAKLELSGLTGSGYIELSAGGESGPNILQEALDNDTYATLTADKSSLANLLATADQIMKRVDDTITQVQSMITTVNTPLTKTVSNIQDFTDVLSKNSDNINTFLSTVGELSGTVKQLSGKLDETLTGLDKVIAAVNPDQVGNIVSNANTITENVAVSSEHLNEVIDQFSKTVETYKGMASQAQSAFQQINDIVAAIDPQKVGSSVDDLASTMNDAKAAVNSIKSVADNVNAHSDQIDSTLTNLSELSKKLNDASTRVDTILTKVDTLLGSDDTKSLSVEARETLESVRQVAETLNTRIGPIADNLDSFSGSGLRNVNALVEQLRTTINSLDRTVSGIARDPQQLIFGGQTVKPYDGRTRY
ncbi:MlaD family protein [Martelella sp. HB161492]|uniref:MlaD family protein n=1 Tax=Martelella sp. HB161492 TaxID=2720726 RepID=UPI00158FFB9F|nr:MlaD family protein [Martelella sp. HB161492]